MSNIIFIEKYKNKNDQKEEDPIQQLFKISSKVIQEGESHKLLSEIQKIDAPTLYQLSKHKDVKGRNLLSYACEKGEYSMCCYMISYGAHISSIDNFGNTPLHYASDYPHMKCVDLLIHQGADMFLKNKKGVSPCDLLIIKCNADKNKFQLYRKKKQRKFKIFS